MSTASDSPCKVDSDESDKTFSCPSVGCNQKFSNANELTIHKQKHQMTLTLGPSKLSNIADVLPIDQTPTPTRFLHLGNKLGLFDELNPFDKEFKTVQTDGQGISSKQRRSMVQQLHAFNSKSKSPSTPTRAATSSDGNTFSVPGQPLHVITITPTLPSPVGTGQFLVPSLLPSPQGLIPTLPGYSATSPIIPANLLSPTLMPFTPGLLPGMSASIMADAQQRAAAFTQAMFAAAASASSSSTTNASLPTLSSAQQLDNYTTIVNASAEVDSGNTAVHRTESLPTASVYIPKQERSMSVSSITSDTSSKFGDFSGSSAQSQDLLSAVDFNQVSSENAMTSSYPVVVQLPNGQTTCVGLSSGGSAMPTSNPASSTSLPSVSSLHRPIMNSSLTDIPNHPTLGPRASSEFGSNSSLADAKLKLKETLTSNNPTLQQVIQNSTIATSEADMKPARRRGRQSQDIDPDVKRQRFLERNRAAASRCRSKKKVWVNDLESKAKNLSQTNVLLQNEIAALKDEVASLKQLLLSHRDCPITKMQQQNMAMAGINLDFSSNSTKSEPNNNTGVHKPLSNTLSTSSIDESLRVSNHQSHSVPRIGNGSMLLNQPSSGLSS